MKIAHYISSAAIVLAIVVTTLPAFAQKKAFSDAKSYSWYIRNMRYELAGKYIDFNRAFRVGNTDELKAARWRYFKEAEKYEAQLQNLEPYAQGDHGFRAAALALVSFYKNSMKKDYLEIVTYYEQENLTKETIAKMKTTINRLSQQELILEEKYVTTKRAFEQAHGLPSAN